MSERKSWNYCFCYRISKGSSSQRGGDGESCFNFALVDLSATLFLISLINYEREIISDKDFTIILKTDMNMFGHGLS
ncbi:MAG: hypothetical protein LBQ13_01080 [Endomicrobium sp.]|nr:hypothetical protein [Endomicrobium sp.]